ncbi:MAG: hypothetical protein PHW02_06200, partial [bacterium]|nr:hypothetical protein [bacterium]
FDAGGDYRFDYFYFDRTNYFSAHTLTGRITNESSFVKFHTEFYGRFYNGDSRYVITYPDIDFSILGFVPPAYIQLFNETEISQLYLSFYFNSVNIKAGRMPVKWGISEIYSPADIFTRELPFSVYSIASGVEAASASYSAGDFTFTAVYSDGEEYEKTKQGISVEHLSGIGSAKLSVGHFFREQVFLLSADTVENLMGSLSFMGDFLGPGTWAEATLFKDERNKRLYLTAGVDYTLFERFYLMAEGFVNFSGLDAPYNDLAHINRLLNGDFVMGKYYLFSNIIINRGEKLEGGIVSASNLDDFSSIAGVMLKCSPRTNISFSLSGVGTTGGKRDEFFRVPFVTYFEIYYSF